MKKASDILIIIGFVFGILAVVGFGIGMIVFFVFASPDMKQMIIDGINSGTIHSDFQGNVEEIATLVQMTFLGAGFGMLAGMLFTIAMCIVAMLAKSKNTSGLHIATIILGFLGGNVLILLGGIFGLVDLSQAK